MIRNTMLISLTFLFIKQWKLSWRYEVHLKAKNKVMCHHLHMQIRRQYQILFRDKFFEQFLITFMLMYSI